MRGGNYLIRLRIQFCKGMNRKCTMTESECYNCLPEKSLRVVTALDAAKDFLLGSLVLISS